MGEKKMDALWAHPYAGEGFAIEKGGTIYPYTVFRAGRITFFLGNRVENQNEGSFWFSTRPTAMGGTDYNALGLWDKLRSSSSSCPIMKFHYNQCLALPKAELKTKTNLRFGFQLDSLKKSDPPRAENRVCFTGIEAQKYNE